MNIKTRVLSGIRLLDDMITEHFGPIRVIFVVRNEMGFANQAPVIHELEKNPEIMIATTSDGEENDFHFEDDALRILYEKYKISPITAVYKKWHYLVCTDILNLYFRRDAVHVAISHGCCFGNGNERTNWIVNEALQPSVKMVFGHSPWLKHYIEETAPKAFETGDKLFFATGFPKLDSLYNGKYSRDQTLGSFNLSPARKTILISSHWTPTSLLATWQEKIVQSLVNIAADYNIIVTAHPKLWKINSSDGFNGKILWKKLKEIEESNANIRVTQSSNSLSLLNATDLLICDNSSIRVEYGILDRPALLFKHPDFQFFSPVTQNLYEDSSSCFSSLENFQNLVQHTLEHPMEKTSGQLALRDHFLHNPGNAAKCISTIIEKTGRISSPNSPAWKKAVKLSKQMSG